MTYDPLGPFRTQLAKAEASLTQARTNMRAAAERHGIPTAGVFAESEFVPRATAHRWAREAKISAQDETIRIFNQVRAISPEPKSSRFPQINPKNLAAEIVAAGKKARGEKG